jgi:hypothetical protein
VFPALFLGAAGGIALSHLPGLPLVPAVAMGIGALCAVVLRLPLTSVLLATLLLYSDGLAVMPLVIVAVIVAYIGGLRLAPSWSVPGTASIGAEPGESKPADARPPSLPVARSATATTQHSTTAPLGRGLRSVFHPSWGGAGRWAPASNWPVSALTPVCRPLPFESHDPGRSAYVALAKPCSRAVGRVRLR